MDASPPGEYRLSYRSPARYWTDALPVGNGRLGAMLYGDPGHDRWQLNDDTCWSGFPGSVAGVAADPEPSPQVIARVRQALFDGDPVAAEQEIRKVQYGHSQAYQPLAELAVITADPSETLHRRILDLHTATAEWQTAEGRCTVFASAPAGAIIGRYRWTSPRDVTIRLTATHEQYGRSRVEVDGDRLLLVSRMPTDVFPSHDRSGQHDVIFDDRPGRAVTAVAALAVITDGGVTGAEASQDLRVTAATDIRLVITTATDFVDPRTEPHGDVAALVQEARRRADDLARQDPDDLWRAHVDDHRSWFDRFDLQLGDTSGIEDLDGDNDDSGGRTRLSAGSGRAGVEVDEVPDTDDLLARSAAAGPSPYLIALMVHYGRYLMISASRPGSRAINLQGIWNPWVQPPWSSNYTVNINTEMNYWPATTTNLAACAEPLFALIETLAGTGRRTARRVYDRPGWAAHHNADIWGFSLPVGTGRAQPRWAAWPMAGLWLVRHLWEHYEFTGDRDFLAQRAWPLLDGAVEFGLATLCTLPDGSLGTAPSTSPENAYLAEDGSQVAVTVSSTMDIALLRDVLTVWSRAAAVIRDHGVGVDTDRERAVTAALAGLPLPEPTARGSYPEWRADLPESEPTHRHQSHLYDLYPGDAVTTADPAQAGRLAAMAESLRLRGAYSTGWSLAWRISLHARLRAAGEAMTSLGHFLAPVPDEVAAAGPVVAQAGGVYRNLFCAHPPFQIDGNFGAAAGVVEMLLQSHAQRDGRRLLDLLPCLPPAWPSGRLHGARARGAITVDVDWSAGRVTTLRLRADTDQQVTIRRPGEPDRDVDLIAGQNVSLG